MALPLYLKDEFARELKNLIEQNRGNTGLAFNKYFNHWDKSWKIEPGGKSQWLKTIGVAGNKTLLAEASERLAGLIASMDGGFRCYKTLWHFATGLGLSHPIENGMAWHHTLGVPYLPGTSLKGIVRTWAEQWADAPAETIQRIFGSNREDNQGSAGGVGSIIFFDALPVAPVRLETDVMTPHYQDYYMKDKAPGDWNDPNPIPFLTVAANQVFLFSIAPAKKSKTGQQDCELVLQWMEEALTNIGAGAKTATGYGRFCRSLQDEKKLEEALKKKEEQITQQASVMPAHLTGPIADEMLKDRYDDSDQFMEALKNKWLVKMQEEKTSPPDRQIIAQLLKNWYQVNRPGQWEKPNRKNMPVIEAIRKVLEEEI